MVGFEEIQAAYYMVAATGVLVAVVYYAVVLRASERNKKIQLSTSIAEKLGAKDFMKNWIELDMLEWRDVEDFMKKYDSSANTEVSRENFAKRWMIWTAYSNLGYLLREGLVDREILFNSLGATSVIIWGRYKPVIDYYRKRQLGPRFQENFEYLAQQMWEMGKTHGYTSPDFKGNLIFDRYREVFEPKTNLSQ